MNALNVYPSPAMNHFSIDLGIYGRELSQLSVLNSAGQTVYVEQLNDAISTTMRINTENWDSGLYTILFEGESSKYVKRLIIQK